MNEWIVAIGTIGFPSALCFFLVYKGLPVILKLAVAVENNNNVTEQMLLFLRQRFK